MRAISHRTRGRRHGFITRLVSPHDLGELVKPFVFLDWFETAQSPGRGFPAHPHSGIATHTTLLRGTFDYGDSTGKSGAMVGGDVEWMRAGGGVWHWGDPRPGPVRGYQLWIALPAALEHAPADSRYLASDEIPSVGPARVLLGSWGGRTSPIGYAEPLTYLHVTLRDGERWTYTPDPDHDVAWLAVHTGALRAGATTLEGELAVFERGGEVVDLEAVGPTELVLGSARQHPHPLACGSYSVHTSRDALIRGEQGIEALARTPIVAEAIRRTAR